MFILPERLWLTADRKRVVADGDPEAAFLLGSAGKKITTAEAKRLDLPDSLPGTKRAKAAAAAREKAAAEAAAAVAAEKAEEERVATEKAAAEKAAAEKAAAEAKAQRPAEDKSLKPSETKAD